MQPRLGWRRAFWFVTGRFVLLGAIAITLGLLGDVLYITLPVGLGVMVFVVAGFVFTTFAARNCSPLVVSGERAHITLRGQEMGSFHEFGLPRLVWFNRLREMDHTVMELPAIWIDRGDETPVILFPLEVPRELLLRLPELANHINAMLAEYQERAVVEQWLRKREAEIAASRAYRSEAHDD